MALEGSNALPAEFLHHHWRHHFQFLKPRQSIPNKSKTPAGEPLVAPTGARRGRCPRSQEQEAEHAGIHKKPLLPESIRSRRELEADPRTSGRGHGFKGRAPRALAGVDQLKQEEMSKQGYGGSDAHHGLAEEGEDGEKDDEAGIEMQQMDLIMRHYNVEERG